MDFKDYYQILGVTRDADAVAIKKAFRKAARKYHPDVNTDPDAETKFKDVNEAYEVLKDPERRATYDQLGQAPQGGSRWAEPPPGWEEGFRFSGHGPQGASGYSGFFEEMFGDGMGAHFGGDSHGRIEVPIEDAYAGAARKLSLRTPAVGPDGRVTLEERVVNVNIPRGILEGQHIRVPGQGGDLFLEVNFAAHPVYRPEGKDLYMDLPVAPWEAALGGHVVLPTPDGRVDLRIPANARTGQKLRLRGKGLPGTPAGDIYATLKIINPRADTEQARALFEQMARDLAFDPRAGTGA